MFALTLLLFMPVWTAANSGNQCIMKNRDRHCMYTMIILFIATVQ